MPSSFAVSLPLYDGTAINIVWVSGAGKMLKKKKLFWQNPLIFIIIMSVAVIYFFKTLFSYLTQGGSVTTALNKEMDLQSFVTLLHSFIQILNVKDQYTEQHSERVKEYASCIAKRLGLDEESVACCRYAGLMHDIGKIGISADILNKKGPLKVTEAAIIRSHPLIGEIFLSNGRITKHVLKGKINIQTILKKMQNDRENISKKIRETALTHHERYNGNGYPRKLKGHMIPVTGYILGIADSFDAMTTHRPYRSKMEFDHALYKLSEEQKNHALFDPDVFVGFVRAKSDIFEVYKKKNSAVSIQ
jgi:HD-GYP domain-containing protein (c-di-GMP phosphodiesterase class II)